MKSRFTVIPTVYLILIIGNRILLSRRYNTGFHDGEYSLPSGHLKPNETLAQAMVREAKEEIGIELAERDLKLVHVMHRKEPNENRVNFFFMAKNGKEYLKIWNLRNATTLDGLTSKISQTILFLT